MGVGVLLADREPARGLGRDALRPPVRQDRIGRDRRKAGRLSPAPRQGPPLPAPVDQLPRQRVRHEGAGRDADHRADRVRLAAATRQARLDGRRRPDRRPHQRAPGHRSTTGRSRRTSRSPTRTARSCVRSPSTRSRVWGSRRTTKAPSSSSRGRASRRARSRSGSARWAGRSST